MNFIVAVLLATSIAFWGGHNQVVIPESRAGLQANIGQAPAVGENRFPAVIRKHTVVAGENLSVIAEQYEIDVDTLLAANPETTETIYPGDELVILPQKGVLYVVESGDSLSLLAKRYNVSVEKIKVANNRQSDQLLCGEKVFIPGGRDSQAVSRGSGARFVWPVNGELSSLFGYRWGRLHSGVDIAAESGTPVAAARSGRVAFSGWRGGYGYAVVISHGQSYSTLYGHLSDYLVDAGQYVGTGQLIGRVGSTGNSTGPHLHFEILVDGQPVNPLNFLSY